MKRGTLMFVLSLLVVVSARGQVAPADQANFNTAAPVLPPAPNAASLGKYGGINVGLSSGTPNINVPLYDYASANLHLPISLSYTTSGFKVDELGSRVGMGWSLNAGGVITRTVHGSPDEVSKRLTVPFTNDRYFYDYVRTVGQNDGISATFDTQPDVYNFNFDGNIGSFIMNDSSLPDGTKAYQPKLLTYSNIKFDRSLTAGSGYILRAITANGVQYLFNDLEQSNTYNDQFASTPHCAYVFSQPIPTAWYLTQIIHPNNDTITLTYSPIQYSYLVSASQTIYQIDNYFSSTAAFCPIAENFAYAPHLDNTLCVNKLETSGVLLNTITSSSGGKLVFNYIDRGDYGEKLLSSIAVYQPDSTQSFKIFDFAYTYPFLGYYLCAVPEISTTSRPFLMSITERSPDSSLTKKHSFLYKDFNELPPRLSYAQDHWGYFNGKNNNTFIPVPIEPDFQQFLPLATANRDPDPEFCEKGCLSSITYPTGGKDSLFYEGNKAPELITTYPAPITLSVTGSTSNGSVVYTSGNATLSMAQVAQFHIYRSDTDHDDSTMSYTNIKLYDNVGNFVWGYDLNETGVYEVTETALLQPGTYHFEMTIFGNNPQAGCDMIYRPGLATTQLQDITVGGVRLAKVLTFDNSGNAPSIKKYYYEAPLSPQMNIYEKKFRLVQRCKDLFPNEVCQDLVQFFYYTMYSNSIYTGYGNPGSVAIYGKVTESYGDNFENGGVEHHFTTESSLGSAPLIGDPIPGAVSVDQSYLNGRETYQKTFKMRDTFRIPIKEVYTVYKDEQGVPVSQLAYTIRQNYNYDCVGTGPVEDIEWGSYDVSINEYNSVWLHPDSIRTLTYDPDGIQYAEERQKYEYGNIQSTMPTKVTTYTSDGRANVINNYYPDDLTLSGNAETARQALIARHMVSPVLQQQMSRGGSATLKTQTDYNVFSNGLVLPAAQSIAVKNSPLDKRLEFYRYTNLGKTLEQGKTGDKKDAYIWDYKKSLPVAQAVNADSASIAYTSFESDGAGNWVIGSPSRNISGALTGHKWYTLNNDLSKSGLSTNVAYIVSYWTKNSSAFNIAGTLTGYPVKGKTVNGWTYYMHKLSGQSSITITGTGPIDEVRLYPVDAQMTTFTYIPLVGISSQCDRDGKLSYYFYDALGRLKWIRDQDGNILKTLEDHYKGQ